MTDRREFDAWSPSTRGTLAHTIRDIIPGRDHARILEVGTGSGRTTRPLLQLGMDPVGVDLSRRKLAQLAATAGKRPLRLIQADAGRLPFPAGSFDVLLTIRVLHLIPAWQTALGEFRRVLRPGGLYLREETIERDNTIHRLVRQQWLDLLAASDLPQPHGGRSMPGIDDFLTALGARKQVIDLGRQQQPTSIMQEVAHIEDRLARGAWQVSPELAARLLARLRAWTEENAAALTRAEPGEEQIRLAVWRFEGAASD